MQNPPCLKCLSPANSDHFCLLFLFSKSPCPISANCISKAADIFYLHAKQNLKQNIAFEYAVLGLDGAIPLLEHVFFFFVLRYVATVLVKCNLKWNEIKGKTVRNMNFGGGLLPILLAEEKGRVLPSANELLSSPEEYHQWKMGLCPIEKHIFVAVAATKGLLHVRIAGIQTKSQV